jgi:hypothetical protein
MRILICPEHIFKRNKALPMLVCADKKKICNNKTTKNRSIGRDKMGKLKGI